MVNLFLAGFWLILGVALLSWHWSHPEDRSLNILGSDFSIGWFAFVLALYNIARWWSSRAAVATQRAMEEAQRRSADRERIRHLPPPDPNFVFTEEENAPPRHKGHKEDPGK